MMTQTCPACLRVFDLNIDADADEFFFYGHDCVDD